MIYTLTINPSLDYIMEMDELNVGKMNRSRNTYVLPGGKGINVSWVLTNLGIENVAVLPVAGFTGEKLLNLLSEKQIAYDALCLKKGDTRINVKVLAKAETELNAPGPEITDAEQKVLMEKLTKLSDGDYLILSGSVPSSLGEHFYARIMEHLANQNVKVVVDTIGGNLKNALTQKPFLVKPNKEELEAFFDTKTESPEELLNLAKEAQKMGAQNVLVSKGAEGAILLTESHEVYVVAAPKGKVVNTVGAGDSMVAGFLAGYIQTGDMENALKWGIAAGSAGAFAKNLATKEEIDALMKNL
ncbi:MAG: 1-phosphofructokinase [Lachnospiraceae bacterium]|nr:1-phosphofructokinase [Lachnospiraceae bacterium]